jgi:hypothetical protein
MTSFMEDPLGLLVIQSLTIFSNNPLNSTKILLIVILIKRGQKCVCQQTSLKQNFTFNKTFR